MATDWDVPVAASRASARPAASRAGRAARVALVLALGAVALALWGASARPDLLPDLLPEPARLVLHWSPALLGGFALNILISMAAMALGTLGGLLVCALALSPVWPLRILAGFHVQVFRNAPKLALVYFASYVFPFEVAIGGHYLPFPDWVKVTAGLALPASAYAAEIFRGAITSIPTAQWEAARSLAFGRWQQLRHIILPQCVKRMLPPWMSLYSIVTMASALASLVGTKDLLSVAQTASASEHSIAFTIAIYFVTMGLFFAYCYPLSRLTRKLERAHGLR